MPQLKKSEKRLLSAFLAVIFIVFNFFLYTMLAKVQQGAEAEVRRLKLQRLEMEDLLVESELWAQRAQWLGSNQPVFTRRDQVDQELLDSIRSAARKYGIDLESEKLPEPKEHPYYVQAVARITAVGDMESVLRW
ncbi:MAG: hypothetical protein ACC661_08595, partial [Verrucomicrobiales bacterium]